MRRSEPNLFPALLAAAIVLTGAAGVAAGARLQAVDSSAVVQRIIAGSSTQAEQTSQATFRFVEDRSELTPIRRPDVAAPKFSRIVIERSGVSRLEGDGSPDSQVLIKSEGVMIGAAVVDTQGHWAVTLERQLEAGDHAITSVAAGRETTQPGDEVRVFIPHDFEGREIVAYDRARRGDDAGAAVMPVDPSTRARAQDLATAATNRFSEIVRPPQDASADVKPRDGASADKTEAPPRAGIDVATPLAEWFARAAQVYKEKVSDKLAAPADVQVAQDTGAKPVQTPEVQVAPKGRSEKSGATAPDASTPAMDPLSAGAAAIKNWLKDANDAYDREIARPLSVPVPGSQAAEGAPPAAAQKPAPKPEPGPVIKPSRPAADTSGSSAEAARTIRDDIIAKQKAMRDAQLREEARVKASGEAQRLEQDLKQRQADDAAAKAREAERAATDRAKGEAEAKKLDDGLKRLDAAQRASAEREAKAAAQADTEARKAKTSQQTAGEARTAKLAEQAKADARKAEVARRAESEAQARKTAAAEAAEAELRKAKFAEQAKIAARRAEQEAREARALERAAAVEEKRAAAAAQQEPLEFTVDEKGDESGREAGNRTKPSRQAQLDDSRNTSVPSIKRSKAERTATRVQSYRSRKQDGQRNRHCQARSGLTRRGMVYVVQPGDTLWAIASRHYRKGSRYNIIYRANQARLPNADVIRPCQKLVLPGHGKKRRA